MTKRYWTFDERPGLREQVLDRVTATHATACLADGDTSAELLAQRAEPMPVPVYRAEGIGSGVVAFIRHIRFNTGSAYGTGWRSFLSPVLNWPEQGVSYVLLMHPDRIAAIAADTGAAPGKETVSELRIADRDYRVFPTDWGGVAEVMVGAVVETILVGRLRAVLTRLGPPDPPQRPASQGDKVPNRMRIEEPLKAEAATPVAAEAAPVAAEAAPPGVFYDERELPLFAR